MKKIWIIILILLGAKIVDAQTNKTAPFVLGLVDTIHSEILSEKRILNIYLPEGYSLDSTTTYPVIYLLDGSAHEDFIHVVGLVQYLTFPWIDGLPKSIVVGISNVNRKRDFTFKSANLSFLSELGYDTTHTIYGGSSAFISCIEKELKPYIENTYKTNGKNTIIGQSLGGLLATEILLAKPNLFDNYLIISPSLWWDKESLIHKAQELLQTHPNYPKKIYIGIGNEEKTMVNDSKEIFQLLQKYGNKNNELYFDYLPNEDHATISHQAIYNAFRLMYGKQHK